MNADLHSHSTASDGLVSPSELVRRAHANGVTLFSLTDHDETRGLAEAAATAAEVGMDFVTGVEISVSWGPETIHVVGLNIAPEHESIAAGLAWVRGSRGRRARRIAEQLESIGVRDALAGAMRHVENPDLISRSHFARFLVERGYGRDTQSVFRNYLVRGKPGYVPHEWTSLGDAIRWIRDAGGIAVVAHPGRYKLSTAEMKTFLEEFREHGGDAIEVITGSHSAAQYAEYAQIARRMDFAASRGSDWHGPGESHVDLGRLPALADDLKPVWSLLR